MRILMVFLLVATLTPCNEVVSQTKTVVASKKQLSVKSGESIKKTKPFLMPKIESIESATVCRLSKHENKHGDNLPPWTEVLVVPYFKLKPILNSKVTVVPLDVDLDSFNWQIAKSEKKEYGCEEDGYAWEVTLRLTQKEFFEFEANPTRRDEFPFDVVVVYPAVEFARQLKKKELTRQMLPKGVSINAVKAAIDVTNDQKPDILLLEFCCDDETESPGTNECDYTCSKTFKQVKGLWKLIDKSSPC